MEILNLGDGRVVELPSETEVSSSDVMSLEETVILPCQLFLEGNIALVANMGGMSPVARTSLYKGRMARVKFCSSCQEQDCECRESGFGSPDERDYYQNLLDRLLSD